MQFVKQMIDGGLQPAIYTYRQTLYYVNISDKPAVLLLKYLSYNCMRNPIFGAKI